MTCLRKPGQPSPYSESDRAHGTVGVFHDRVSARFDLDEIAKTLKLADLEVLLAVARRLARAEERR
jgi:hypothetical protein